MFESVLSETRHVVETAAEVDSLVKVLQDFGRDECKAGCCGIRGKFIVEEVEEASDGMSEELAADGTEGCKAKLRVRVFDKRIQPADRRSEVSKKLNVEGASALANIQVLAEHLVDAIFDIGQIGSKVFEQRAAV